MVFMVYGEGSAETQGFLTIKKEIKRKFYPFLFGKQYIFIYLYACKQSDI
jgi:hypothetical protein